MPQVVQIGRGSLTAVGNPGQGTTVQVFLIPPQTGDMVAPGPQGVVKGHVLVNTTAKDALGTVEIQFRGVEVVGGTMADLDNDLEELHPRKGARSLNRVYFDEQLVLWDHANTALEHGGQMMLPFAIVMPKANYPAEIKSLCDAAPSQSFEICYQVIARALAKDGESVLGRFVQEIPFVPLLTKPLSAASNDGQHSMSRIAYDDRGNECAVTCLTLAQAEYVPGDQVVGGLYIECTKANRTIRKAECQLRQRIQCRMRRTFNSVEVAERSASSSRPQSSQKSPADISNESDILWTRVVEMGSWKQLTLTSVGVGLAAAAAQSANGYSASSNNNGSSSIVSSPAEQQLGDQASEAGDKKDSVGRSKSIIASNRPCSSANIHTDIPSTAPMIPGHFLSFSYELVIAVTISSLTRGTQRVTTRMPLGSSLECATPTPVSGRPQSSCHIPAVVEEEDSSESAPSIKTTSTGKRNKTLHAEGRFSVGAFQEKSNEDTKESPTAKFNTIKSSKSMPIRSDAESAATRSSGAAAINVYTSIDQDSLPLPNAVEQLRYRYDTVVQLTPRITVPTDEVTNDSRYAENVDSGAAGENKDVATENTVNTAKATEDTTASPIPQPVVGTKDATAFLTPSPSAGATTPIATATTTNVGIAADEKFDIYDSKQQQEQPTQGDEAKDNEEDTSSINSSESDLAHAVNAAAKRVLNDKEWERPISYFMPATPASAPLVLDSSGFIRSSRLTSNSVYGNVLANTEEISQLQLNPLMATRDGMGIFDEQGVEEAINELAPAAKPQNSTGSSTSVAGSSVDIKQFMQGMEFFGSESSGPELTGMLSAKPDDLAVRMSLADDGKDGKGAAAFDSNKAAARASAWSQPAVITSGVLRRSVSMPDATSPMTAGATVADNAASTGAGAMTDSGIASEESMAYEKTATGVRAVFGRGNRQLIPTNNSTSQLMKMQPRSVISAVSSASRIGATSRVGVLRIIGNKFTSWFNKK
ncbi:hypothetical protein GGI12_000241 [Dipsacomyces acuminosporus]|nr:hypothetical protein GGI12_000241 [Dipsacomyces acuminosporus]